METRLDNENGAALLELILVVPVLALLYFGSVEMNEVIQVSQRSDYLVRQVALGVFHECKDLDLSDANTYSDNDAEQCVKSQAELFSLEPSEDIRAGAVIVSLYRWESGEPRLVAKSRGCRSSESSVAGFYCDDATTKYGLERVKSELGTVLEQAGWLVVVEGFLPHESLLRGVWGLTKQQADYLLYSEIII